MRRLLKAVYGSGVMRASRADAVQSLRTDVSDAAAVIADAERPAVAARTEATKLFARGQLDAMRTVGVGRVQWVASRNACPRCRAMDGAIVALQDAVGRIPLHPNCTCYWRRA